jgi:hypothetical protein
MTIEETIDLNVLSQHLHQRQQMAWGQIEQWDISVKSILALPRFLSQHPYINCLTIRKHRVLSISIGRFLSIDWSLLSGKIEDPPRLRHLAVMIDFGEACTPDLTQQIQSAIETHAKSPSIFTLSTLTVKLDHVVVHDDDVMSLPPISLIAEYLIHLGGPLFKLHIDTADRPGGRKNPLLHYTFSQLVKEIALRQDRGSVRTGKMR